jgi:hypothetical protein
MNGIEWIFYMELEGKEQCILFHIPYVDKISEIKILLDLNINFIIGACQDLIEKSRRKIGKFVVDLGSLYFAKVDYKTS